LPARETAPPPTKNDAKAQYRELNKTEALHHLNRQAGEKQRQRQDASQSKTSRHLSAALTSVAQSPQQSPNTLPTASGCTRPVSALRCGAELIR